MMLLTKPEELERFTSKNRLWQGIPSIERSKGGRLFSTFYSGGITEMLGNFCVLVQSDDDGLTWSEPIAVAYAGEKYRCYDPCLWMDPLGRLWFTWGVAPERAVYAVWCEDPDAEVLQWSDVKKIGEDVMMNKPIVLSDGDWIFPITVWTEWQCAGIPDAPPDYRKERLAFAYRSNDRGEPFQRLGGVDMPKRSFDEHMILELKDGRLMMLVRTTYGIGKSYSYDGGQTWTEGEDTGWGGPCSRFHIRRLKSGNILLLNHWKNQGRDHLTAMISRDECETWEGFLLLDERDNVSYPDATETEDGTIYLTYDRERGAAYRKMTMEKLMQTPREILMARITEEDILAGKLVNPASFLKRIISRLGEYKGDLRDPYKENLSGDDYEYLEKQSKLEPEAIVSNILQACGGMCLSVPEKEREQMDRYVAEILQTPLTGDKYSLLQNMQKLINLLISARGVPEIYPHTDLMDKIFEYISLRLSENIQLDQMAKDLFVSKFYLCHVFKKNTGTTVVQYITQQRISLAKKLLRSTDQSLTEIASAVGYESPSYFSQIFREKEGITPKSYRELN